MKTIFYSIASVLILSLISCEAEHRASQAPTPGVIELHDASDSTETSPKDMLKEAYQQFKEGNDAKSIELANQVLAIGRDSNNDTLIGGALSSLCRNAQRTLDTTRLGELSVELAELAETSGRKVWMMKRAHMNAEMWRLVGNMDRAEAFYDESMSISFALDEIGMYTIDHFNKSFVATAKGDFEMARELIGKYYDLRALHNPEKEDAYGLISLAYILEQEKNYAGAQEVACVTRRLFKQQNIFPEPPDEQPLLAVEAKCKSELNDDTLEIIKAESVDQSVGSLVEKYLNL
jgi:tetratricopeptide (TPR) repeat protein